MEHAGARRQTTGSCVLCCLQCCLRAGCCRGLTGRVPKQLLLWLGLARLWQINTPLCKYGDKRESSCSDFAVRHRLARAIVGEGEKTGGNAYPRVFSTCFVPVIPTTTCSQTPAKGNERSGNCPKSIHAAPYPVHGAAFSWVLLEPPARGDSQCQSHVPSLCQMVPQTWSSSDHTSALLMSQALASLAQSLAVCGNAFVRAPAPLPVS